MEAGTGAASAAAPVELDILGALALCRRGDAAGWDWLFDRYFTFVCRYAAARLGDPHSAEDIAQEVFVAAVGSIRRLRDRTGRGVEGWLLGIARNKVRDRLRQASRRPPVLAEPEDEPDAGEVVARRSTTTALRSALEELSSPQRDVVIRRFVLDQSLEEVAAMTGRSVGAVKSLQHRALAQLARRRGEITG